VEAAAHPGPPSLYHLSTASVPITVLLYSGPFGWSAVLRVKDAMLMMCVSVV